MEYNAIGRIKIKLDRKRRDEMSEATLYHGSRETVEFPEIRAARYNKDFYFGFYCTRLPEQARRWATRFTGRGIVNEYAYVPDTPDKLPHGARPGDAAVRRQLGGVR